MLYFKKIIFGVLISIMKILLSACFILLSLVACNPSTQENAPKLVVGIVVDQMRYDYLTRYWDDFGPNGFKRFYKDGFVAHNHHFNYYQTLTANMLSISFLGKGNNCSNRMKATSLRPCFSRSSIRS